ncbi:MAG: hypothetical protein GX780_03295 [Campylobacteraceae bacterium]|nr:hypothetical protein [Campylobacteraceae bacterium]
MFPRSIYFQELAADEDLNDEELEILANTLEKRGVVIDSQGEMELERLMHPILVENKRTNRPEKWWIVLSSQP